MWRRCWLSAAVGGGVAAAALRYGGGVILRRLCRGDGVAVLCWRQHWTWNWRRAALCGVALRAGLAAYGDRVGNLAGVGIRTYTRMWRRWRGVHGDGGEAAVAATVGVWAWASKAGGGGNIIQRSELSERSDYQHDGTATGGMDWRSEAVGLMDLTCGWKRSVAALRRRSGVQRRVPFGVEARRSSVDSAACGGRGRAVVTAEAHRGGVYGAGATGGRSSAVRQRGGGGGWRVAWRRCCWRAARRGEAGAAFTALRAWRAALRGVRYAFMRSARGVALCCVVRRRCAAWRRNGMRPRGVACCVMACARSGMWRRRRRKRFVPALSGGSGGKRSGDCERNTGVMLVRRCMRRTAISAQRRRVCC